MILWWFFLKIIRPIINLNSICSTYICYFKYITYCQIIPLGPSKVILINESNHKYLHFKPYSLDVCYQLILCFMQIFIANSRWVMFCARYPLCKNALENCPMNMLPSSAKNVFNLLMRSNNNVCEITILDHGGKRIGLSPSA